MPIKLPKSFARRKSSANVLEEVENPPQPSFRLIERHTVDGRSLDKAVSKKLNEEHSPPENLDNIFAGTELPLHQNRGSGGTDHSASTGRMYESSSSTQFSSSSTLPSSADVPVHDDALPPHSRNHHDLHIPPLAGALRAAGRTFSFGARMSKMSTPPPPPQHSTPGPSRSRAMTASTSSTATPPKLPDEDLDLGGLEDDFRNMFQGLGKRESAVSKEPSSVQRQGDLFPSSPPNRPSAVVQNEEKEPQVESINADRFTDAEPPRRSWGSRHSGEGLLTGFEPGTEDAFAPTRGPRHSYTMPLDRGEKPLPSPNPMPIPTTSHRSLQRPITGSDRGLRRSVMWSDRPESTPIDDADAKLVMESLLWNKTGSQLPSTPDPECGAVHTEESLFESQGNTVTNRPESPEADSTPRAHQASEPTEIQLDPSIAAHARLAAQYEKRVPKSASPPNKVMTPSQFEHYRQQQELRRSNSDASDSEDSNASDFDEDDEAEKNRQAEKHRRKQEAHLSVYRQQMMKVTGQQSPPPLSLRPEMSNSTPNLAPPASNLGSKPGSGKSSDGDDDEEIPLGILAAHGFPNRNRPPTRLLSSSSIPNLRASLQPSYVSPGSTAGNDLGNRGSLPVFARNLPRDPYFGASLVNPSNRESLAMSGGSSVHGGPSSTLHPGGLVGVIATEERARAMRRGSPNPQAGFDHQFGMPGMAPTPNGVPRPFTMMSMNMPAGPAFQPAPSATEQAQIQLSQQMSTMVQMQMQWMQQMMQMQGAQGMQGSPQLPMPKTFAPPLATNTNMRPVSVHSTGAFDNPANGAPQADRTLSMLDPNVSSRWNGSPMPFASPNGNRPGTPVGQGYAPSIAPSERSNIGMAPRYRPVSTIPQEQMFNKRSSTFTSSTLKPWNDENQRISVVTASASQSQLAKASPLATVAVRPITSDGRSAIAGKKNIHAGSDDEDDEEAWAEMMKKREKKKSSWKMKRGTSTMGDLLSSVH